MNNLQERAITNMDEYRTIQRNISTNLDACWDHFLKPNFKGMKKQVDIAHFVKEKTKLNYSTVYSHKSELSNPNHRMCPIGNLFAYATAYGCHFQDFFLNTEDFKNKIIHKKDISLTAILKQNFIKIQNYNLNGCIEIERALIKIDNLEELKIRYIEIRGIYCVFLDAILDLKDLKEKDIVVLKINNEIFIKEFTIDLLADTVSFKNLDNIVNEDFLINGMLDFYTT